MESLNRVLIVVSVVTILLISTAVFFASDPGASCWCPAQFTASHRAYTNDVCSNFLKNGEIYKPEGNEYALPRDDFMSDIKKNKTKVSNRREYFKYYLPIELVLALFSFAIGQQFLNFKSPDESGQSEAASGLSLIGSCVVALVTAVVWLVMALVSTLSISHHGIDSVFLCDYEIRHQSRIHHYLVQCTVDLTRHDGLLYLNPGLCVALGVAGAARAARAGYALTAGRHRAAAGGKVKDTLG